MKIENKSSFLRMIANGPLGSSKENLLTSRAPRPLPTAFAHYLALSLFKNFSLKLLARTIPNQR